MEDYISSLAGNDTAAKRLSCIIIDDEPIARRGMALFAAKHPALDLKSVFPGSREALQWMESNSADLVFLDIEIPGIKGIDLAALLPDDTMVVFTTAYSEYAVSSYDLDAVDYLLKPFDAVRFDRAVQKALMRMAARRAQSYTEPFSAITLRADRKFVNINPDNIIYIEGEKDYVRIHTDSGRIISRITIKSMLERLPPSLFLRIHKSYVINMSRVKAYDNSCVIIHSDSQPSGQIELPVGAAFRSDMQERYKT
ncbi:MAG: LytTR family DNA-binding domain-containing protein [Muribaculaceae bacterium]|nr:LytTR family DNA-binding domain-containing protein [Muribaculaceae bacterium]